jgi:putative ABC transport system permease protein
MGALTRFFKKLFARRRLDRDLEDELRFHLEMRGDARRFGNATLIKEACREVWSFVWLESWWWDFRYALRMLARTPGVTTAAIAALALGIGANTAVYTIVSKAFSFDIGVDRPDRLVLIGISPAHLAEFSKNLFDPRVLRARVTSLDRVGAFRYGPVTLSDAAGPVERYSCFEISAGGIQMLGRPPLLGRVITADDERTGAPLVMLSHGVWQDRYGADPSVIGKTVRVDEVARTIVGVMPAGMRFPEDTALWIPFSREARRNDPMLFARLTDGVTLPRARSEIEAFARSLIGGRAATREPLVDVQPVLMLYGVYAARPLFIAQLVAVGFVLLIACADVANLLLGRAVVRGREISIRMAIGAGRARILRQLLVESAALAMAGGLIGWMIALAGLRWFDQATAKMQRPAWMDFSMNPHVLLYFAAITIGASVLFGLAPALRLARVDVNHSIKDGGQGASGGTRGRSIGNVLVAFEMALCMVLLAGAGLLIRSSLNVYRAPIGVDPSNLLTMQIDLPEGKYRRDEEQVAFHQQLKTRLESIAGVEGAALASALPTWGFGMARFQCELEGSRVAIPAVEGLAISANYFRVMRAELRRGRAFQAHEAGTVIVNEAFASEYFAGADPIGKHLRIGQEWLTVIGIAPNIQQDFRRPAERVPLIYMLYDASPQRSIFVTARTRVPPTGLAEAFRQELRSLDEDLPAYDLRTLDSRIAQNRLNVGSISALLTIFAGIALVMAFVGLYAVVAHAVSQRTQEIGIRMAMGAAPRDVLALVFVQGLRPATVGLLVGLAAALAVTRVLRMTLVGVSANDPATFAGVILVLATACVLGCAIPAWQAVRVDPVAALRRD